jgi:secondary thiamine-phosphate synthase enzyme
MRLKSAIWAAAYIRRCQVEGAFAVLRKRGAEEAGAIFIKVDRLDGTVMLFLRHTSASLTIQENADPDVLRDLVSALRHLAPRDFGWIHDSEGPDDMPAHVRTMLTGVSLQIPVLGGRLQLGTWQAVYLIEHRSRPHRRQIVLQFAGRGH